MCGTQTCKRVAFYIIIFVTIVPIFLFPIYSANQHTLYQIPKVNEGVLDLAGYDMARQKPVPLDGVWEFYWEKWLITDGLPEREPDLMLPVAKSWSKFELNGNKLPQQGYGTYRIVLENCPKDLALMCYVPYIGAAYRVFIDGESIAESGVPTKDSGASSVYISLRRAEPSFSDRTRRELVIELSSKSVGGLYVAPILQEYAANAAESEARYMLALVYIGILIATLSCYVLILCLGHSTIQSIALLALDLLVLLRILMKDEFFGVVKRIIPFFQYHMVNSTLNIMTLFLPVLFLICSRDLLGMPINRNLLRRVFYFELLCGGAMFLLALAGDVYWQNVLCFVSFLPFIPVLVSLYRDVKAGVPYSLTVSLGIMLVLSSLIVASQTASGVLIINISMFPSTCFVASVFLQDYIYIKRNTRLYDEALEAAKLRLRLKESETALMLSQIKPHFLYNALQAIQVLCTREPETAAEAILQFARYLRANMQSINSSKPIPFTQELEHIRNYAAIEKLRFRNRLTIRYEIGPQDFMVPPLTIQPLVENAIKHGACKNLSGGTVVLRTYEEPDYWCVEIVDDGPGFDALSVFDHPPEGSYGLQNIALRMQQMMNAVIRLDSVPDRGTRALVRLPRTEAVE